jgi:hypothetical protein
VSARRWWWIGGIAALAVAAAVVLATATRSDAEDACEAPKAAPASDTALMPEGLSFDQIGTVTHVEKKEPNVEVTAVSEKPLDELTVLIQDAVTAAGYRPAGMDNEGDEAEVFFQSGSLAAGQARVEGSGCEGRWEIELVLLDRAAGG